MTGKITLEELATLVDKGSIHTVMAAIVDMQGRLMGKRFHARHFLESAHSETHCCNYLLATDLEMYTVEGFKATSWERGYGDYTMRPDLATLRLAAWSPGTALVLCDVLDHHGKAPVPHSPRQVLKRQLTRARERGLDVMAATELEFFIFEASYAEIRKGGFRDLAPLVGYNQDYALGLSSGDEPVMARLRNVLWDSGVPVEGTKGEAEVGQEELNLRYGGALEAAENHTIAKHVAKEIGAETGHAVSFLPKWHPDRVGSATHIHLSLWSGKDPAFLDGSMPLGMSRLMRAFVAGLIRSLDDCTVFLAPYVNSYKRFREGSFAPTRKVWAVDNRTAALRLCGDGTTAIRIECRLPGADANPYLAVAALVAAGLDGIAQHLECGEPAEGDAYGGKGAHIPRTLREATLALHGSSMLRAAMGDDVVDHYVHAAEWEQEAFDRAVTDWEIARGFERA